MKRIILVFSALLVAASLSAEVRLPAVLSDGAVLQRNTEVNLWGWATPGSKVSISPSWTSQKYSASVASDGTWKTKVHTADAGGPYTITFSDSKKSQTTLNDIMLGEVWVCSGQSNMEMPVKGFVSQRVNESAQTIRDSYAHKKVRYFNVLRHDTDTLQTDCKGEWRKPTPENVAECSAIAYFFGRMLSDILDMPVGLVTSYWGGTMIETWMTKESIMELPVDKSVFDSEHEGTDPQHLYNGMINPIVNYTAKGFIWYQGESNRAHAFDYGLLMNRMIRLWRDAWGNQDMPFIMAQLAQYRYDGAEYLSLPAIVEQQYVAADMTPDTYVAPTTDLDSPRIIHPARKRECAERMAAIALDHAYGIKGIPGESPRYSGMEIDGRKIIVHFKGMADNEDWPTSGESFSWVDKDLGITKVKGFEIAGEDGVFYPAKASLGWPVADRITVESDSVAAPVAVRYAFRNYIEANVITTAGVPLAPFRTDKWDLTPMLFKKN